MKLRLTIPEDLSFSDLELARGPNGQVAFRVETINRICAASGIDSAAFWKTSEDNVAGLIIAWYRAHLDHGGDPDPVAESLILEVVAEDEHDERARNN